MAGTSPAGSRRPSIAMRTVCPSRRSLDVPVPARERDNARDLRVLADSLDQLLIVGERHLRVVPWQVRRSQQHLPARTPGQPLNRHPPAGRPPIARPRWRAEGLSCRSRSLFFRATCQGRFGGLARSIAVRAGGRCECTGTVPPGYRVTQLSPACIRKSPRRRKGPRSTARMVAGTSGCSRRNTGRLVGQGPWTGQRRTTSATSAALAASGAIHGRCPALNTSGKPAQALAKRRDRCGSKYTVISLPGNASPWPRPG